MTTAGKFSRKITGRKMWPVLMLALMLLCSNSLALASGHLELCPQDSGAFKVVLHADDHSQQIHSHNEKSHHCSATEPEKKMSHKHKPLCCDNNISHPHLQSFLLKPDFRQRIAHLISPQQSILQINIENPPTVFFLSGRADKEPYDLKLQAIKLIRLQV